MKKRLKFGAFALLTLMLLGVLYYNYQFFLQDARYGIVTPTMPMSIKRSAHTATLLPNGKVIIIGGIVDAEGVEENTETTEFYNPINNTFEKGISMPEKRAGHTATLLKNGKVLVTGGFNDKGFLKSAILINLMNNQIEPISDTMTEARNAHTATLLDNGRVLLVGGVDGGEKANEWIDIYDPNTNSITKCCKLTVARTGHTATSLKDGRVLIVGGSENWRSNVLKTNEIFDPSQNTVTLASSLNIPRNKHAEVLMEDGKVMIIGGSDDAESIGGWHKTCEIYDPLTNSFDLLPAKMIDGRFKITNAATIAKNGYIVIGGNGRFVEIYDTTRRQFFTAKGSVDAAWMYPTVTALHNGKVLICGGYDSDMAATLKAWVLEF